ncbi:MAG: hypothetical protein ACK5Z5_02330 [Neisseriaceae bacterium]
MPYPDGLVYEGCFINGEAHDKNGVLTFSNGDVYKGNFKNGRRTGKGIVSPVVKTKFNHFIEIFT